MHKTDGVRELHQPIHGTSELQTRSFVTGSRTKRQQPVLWRGKLLIAVQKQRLPGINIEYSP